MLSRAWLHSTRTVKASSGTGRLSAVLGRGLARRCVLSSASALHAAVRRDSKGFGRANGGRRDRQSTAPAVTTRCSLLQPPGNCQVAFGCAFQPAARQAVALAISARSGALLPGLAAAGQPPPFDLAWVLHHFALQLGDIKSHINLRPRTPAGTSCLFSTGLACFTLLGRAAASWRLCLFAPSVVQ